MAINHIPINTSSPKGGALRIAIDTFQKGFELLKTEVNAMPGMVNGSDYSHLEEQYGIKAGFGDNAKGELDAVIGRLTTDGSITGTASAIQQMFNFLH